jgi:hypothetical protein
MDSCEQAMYCTYLSVWSVELWTSAAAMCCAPSASMRLDPRLYTHVCEKNDAAHVHSSRCAIPYTQPSTRSYAPMHTCMRTYQIQTRVHVLNIYVVHNAPVHTIHKCAPLLCTSASRLCTALTRVCGVWSCGQVLQQCAALPPHLCSCCKCCTHMCVRKTIQRTCIAHDARFHTHNRVRSHIPHHTCIRACRHNKYKHACMPCTYTYLHSSAQRNSTYHARTRPTTMHSCEQAMYCTHLSVWSVELWTSAAAMCCAPSSRMRLL